MATPVYTKEAMRARFDELNAQVEAIKAVAGPLREKRDEIVQTQAKIADELNAEIKAKEEGLFDLEMERAMLARAVGTIETVVEGPLETGVSVPAEEPANGE